MDPYASKAVSYGTLSAQSFQLKTGSGTIDCAASNGTLAIGGSNTSMVQVSTSNAVRLTVNSNGNVGIGTTVALAKLDVNGVISNRGGSNTVGYIKISQDAARTGYIDFRNPDDSRMGYIGYGDSNSGLNLFMDQSVNLLFSTAGTERMRITSGGNVGVGTSGPLAFVHVASSSNGETLRVDNNVADAYVIIEQKQSGTSTRPGISFRKAGTVLANISNDGGSNGGPTHYDALGTNGRHVFYTNSSQKMSLNADGGLRIEGAPSVQGFSLGGRGTFGIDAPGVINGRFIITDNTGLVGIGTASPAIKLDVAGTDIGIGRTRNWGSPHDADKRDGLWIGRWDGTVGYPQITGPTGEFCGMVPKVVTGASVGESNDNQSIISFYTWGYAVSSSREVMRITQRGACLNIANSYGALSDERIKENIADARGYLEDLKRIRIVKYSLKDEKRAEADKLGVIAQEVAAVFPGMTETMDFGDHVGIMGVKMSVFTPMLIKAVQELAAENAELRSTVNTMKAFLAAKFPGEFAA